MASMPAGSGALTRGQQWTAVLGTALVLGMLTIGLPQASGGSASTASPAELPSRAARQAGLVPSTPAAAAAVSDVPPLPALEPDAGSFGTPSDTPPADYSPPPAADEPTTTTTTPSPTPTPTTPPLPVPLPVPVPAIP